eukprot:1161555-Pelagomonas_calceolata.AAC.12
MVIPRAHLQGGKATRNTKRSYICSPFSDSTHGVSSMGAGSCVCGGVATWDGLHPTVGTRCRISMWETEAVRT